VLLSIDERRTGVCPLDDDDVDEHLKGVCGHGIWSYGLFLASFGRCLVLFIALLS
jgi:hypothetical protein